MEYYFYYPELILFLVFVFVQLFVYSVVVVHTMGDEV